MIWIHNKYRVLYPEQLSTEFYTYYDPEVWYYRLRANQRLIDNPDLGNFDDSQIEFSAEKTKSILKSEIHFMYFQMIETLFELIMGISGHDSRYLWMAISYANDRKSPYYSNLYKRIEALAQCDTADPLIQNDELIYFLFYCDFEAGWDAPTLAQNVAKIRSFLIHFAQEFNDRGEYNAFKHGLRVYNKPLYLKIVSKANPAISLEQKSDHSHVYLSKTPLDEDFEKVQIIAKPFEYQKDVRCCEILYELIFNLIETRRRLCIKALQGKDFYLYDLSQLNLEAVLRLGTTAPTITRDI